MKHIIDNINRIAGKYTPHQVFADWVEMSALSIAQSIEPVEEREEAFFSIARKYSEDDFFTLGCMLGRLSFLLENSLDDYLGKIYMELSTGNSHTGQFFTPFHVCEMMAGIALANYNGGIEYLNEPSSGGGANILAYAKVMKAKGYNYQQLLEVKAQDLDYKCVYMTYLQLSLAGVNAEVIQGNSLEGKHSVVLHTPMHVMRGVFSAERRNNQ
jgi:type I restriction-modification system DNA methylase subunit